MIVLFLEFPNLYFFITGDVRSLNRLLRVNHLYRVNFGANIILHSFAGGVIHFVTDSDYIFTRKTKYVYPFDGGNNQPSEIFSADLDFHLFYSSIVIPSDNHKSVIVEAHHQIKDRNFKCNKVCTKTTLRRKQYQLDLNFGMYIYQKYVPIMPTTSSNWFYPRLVDLGRKMNQLRDDALRADCTQLGPRILVIGPSGSGKRLTLPLLINMALLARWRPLVVDIDVGQSCIGPSGTVGLCKLTNPFELGEEYHFEKGYPILFHFGFSAPNFSIQLYQKALKCLVNCEKSIRRKEMQTCETKSNNPTARLPIHIGHSGIIINTHGWTDGLGYDMFLDLIGDFKIDHIFVHACSNLHDRLVGDLFPGNTQRCQLSDLLTKDQIYFVPNSNMILKKDDSTK